MSAFLAAEHSGAQTTEERAEAETTGPHHSAHRTKQRLQRTARALAPAEDTPPHRARRRQPLSGEHSPHTSQEPRDTQSSCTRRRDEGGASICGCSNRPPAIPRRPPELARANKRQIKAAVKELYDIEVEKVNTLIRPDGVKKAYVKLSKDQDALDVSNRIGII